MSTFVMVHGAWGSKWHWEGIAERLEAAGHKAIALDNPGHGDSHEDIAQQDASSYARAAAKVIMEQDEPVILVGHSLGGAIISLCAEICPEKIKRLIYVTAWLLKPGRSVDGPTSVRPLNWADAAKEGLAKISDDGKVTILEDSFIAKWLANDLTEEQTAELCRRKNPEAPAAQYENVYTTEKFMSIPRVYVRTTLDASILPQYQDEMIAELPCERVYSIEAGHMVQFSKPDELTEILLKEAAID
ncbi:MAG: alpha/beta fold hydrolase [Oscillospiraceae bacterium]|nr:alpha/beta fold hydrolase [Oscillospiraceae bacterium]